MIESNGDGKCAVAKLETHNERSYTLGRHGEDNFS